ncbi:MAG: LPS-assembly protein LptD, partial [Planctomycetota bacterium]
YLEGSIKSKKPKKSLTTHITEVLFDKGDTAVVLFNVSGEVFITADKNEQQDPRSLPIYTRSQSAVAVADKGQMTMPQEVYPDLPMELLQEKPSPEKEKIAEIKPASPPKPFQMKYPVSIAPAGEVQPTFERSPAKTPEGFDIVTVIGRFYIWQKKDEKGGLLELQADNAVIYYISEEEDTQLKPFTDGSSLTEDSIKGIYLAGNVVMTEGLRTIRADELYYDFQDRKALAVNANIRSYDVKRGVPIYVQASKLRQVAENQFAAEDITLTTSEFYKPQISLNASSVIITDTTSIDAQADKLSDRSFDADMRDVRMKYYDTTIFYWPHLRGNLLRPDIPIKSASIGNSKSWGTSLETQWYLSRLLGLREPEGTDSLLALDYYSKRGPGAGIDIDYKGEDYFGEVQSYLIHDTGEDRLGRIGSRKNVEPPQELRGRFSWRHRQFLPYNWQLTTGVSYLSDQNFLESFYRREFNKGLDQETYMHLKRIEDNWGLSFLAKARLNDFQDVLEELPSFEYHRVGESLFEDIFTLYSDTEISRLKQRIGNDNTIAIDENFYSFISHRMELDMPLRYETIKIVPYTAGTFGYDDRSGFTRSLVDGQNTGELGEDQVWIGELGIRAGTQFSKVYPYTESRLWDVKQLRHIIEPQVVAAIYEENASEVEQLDTLNFGISQRLQTKRGREGSERTVDWMRLDIDFTWVDDSISETDAGPGPDQFIWNKPFVPLRQMSAPEIMNGDLSQELQRFSVWGPKRNYFSADYIWRISDTTALLSDLYFDMLSSDVQQLDIGISRMRWPNLTYYIGSRYLRRVQVLDEKGSNSFVSAATYILDPRYTLVFSQQYDFDYGANVRSDITVIRRYH